MLVDLVSRGGNLLLDIGPDADGTIPVVMEQRLTEIGNWLAVNGDAIYGTRPFTVAKQWGAGEVPKIDYNKEYDSAYDVSKLTGPQPAGKASIEAFFTRKGSSVYAILTRWPGRRFTWKDAGALAPTTISLVGAPGALRFTTSGDTITVELPDLPEPLLAQPLWVLKLVQ
jgi:alpha-L-fucosidase